MDPSILVIAMVSIMTAQGQTPTTGQQNEMTSFANAIITMVQGATVVYDGASLLSASPGDPVTEAVPTVTGLTLS